MSHDPLIDFLLAEQPFLTNLVGGHPLVANPLGNGLCGYGEIGADIPHLQISLDSLFLCVVWHGLLRNIGGKSNTP